MELDPIEQEYEWLIKNARNENGDWDNDLALELSTGLTEYRRFYKA